MKTTVTHYLPGSWHRESVQFETIWTKTVCCLSPKALSMVNIGVTNSYSSVSFTSSFHYQHTAGRLMIFIASKGHFLTQIPHPMHNSSLMHAICMCKQRMMQTYKSESVNQW